MAKRHENYKQIVNSIQKTLAKYGHRNVDFEDVLFAYDKALSGATPKGMIEMMTRDIMRKEGYLEGALGP